MTNPADSSWHLPGRSPARRRRPALGALYALLGMAAITGPAAEAQNYGPDDLDEAFGRATAVISASSLACHRFDLWLATDRSQQMRGLMFVRDLPAFTGMLFVYDSPGRRSMWMKNTYISLDMLFIREDGTISSIETDTETLSLRSISSIEPVTLVLELNAGATAALGIAPGDRLLL